MQGKGREREGREYTDVSTALPKVVDPHTYLEVPVDVVEPRDGAAETVRHTYRRLPHSVAEPLSSPAPATPSFSEPASSGGVAHPSLSAAPPPRR